MKKKDAIKFIEKEGILLVYPIHNQSEPKSLWSEFFPKSRMRWEWDDGGDDRVAKLWHLREELSRSGEVVYAKWYQGRATFFSKSVFPALASFLNRGNPRFSEDATRILEVLELNSPLSTKALKKVCEMTGKANERRFEKSLKELWSRLRIVGYGEVDDGAFPSLSVGATRAIFEGVWQEAEAMPLKEALSRLSVLSDENAFKKFLNKLMQSQETKKPVPKKRISIIRGSDLIK